MTEKIIKFLKDNEGIFKISAIESATGIPATALRKAMRGLPSRSLTDDQEKALQIYFKTLRVQLEKHFC